MSGMLSPVQWLWAFSVLAQVTVFALLFLKGNFRKLPLFTTYVALNLCQAGFLLMVYAHYGTKSHAASILGWASEAATLLAQALATTEVLRRVLGPYRGIWGLGWRALAVTSSVVLIWVGANSRGNWDWALFEADRGYHLTFAAAVIACLLLVRFYSIPVAAPYKAILGGFCLFSCTMILINTIAQGILYPRFANYEPIWQFISMAVFAVVQVVWAVGLRKPLPVEAQRPTMQSDSIYQRISPEINERLRELNEKLLRLWKLEARPQ